MTRVTRLLLAVAVAATASSARAAEVDPLLPKEAEQVIFVNFKQLLESDLLKKYGVPQAKDLAKKDEVQVILEKIGIDPFKDIANLTLAIWEDAPGTPPNMLAIVRGKFDGDVLIKAADEFSTKFPKQVAIVTEEELKMIKTGGGDERGKPMYVHVADETTIIAGTSPKFVAASVTAKKTKAKAKLGRELTALVLKQDAKASAFVCQLLDGKLAKIPNLGQIPGINGELITEQLGNLATFSMTLRVGKDITVEMAAGMKDADAAEAFGGTMGKLLDLFKTTILPLAPLRFPNSKTLIDDLTKSLKHVVKKSEVVLSAKLSPEALGQLLGALEE